MGRGHPLDRHRRVVITGKADGEPADHLRTKNLEATGHHGSRGLPSGQQRHATAGERLGMPGCGAARQGGRVHGVERSGNQRVEVGVELCGGTGGQ